MMKTILAAVLIVGATAAPALSLAQEATAPTRAQVQAQARLLADAGYRGRGDETTYPSDVQAAQLRAGEQQARGAPADTSGYGSQRGPQSESGAREPKGPASIYFGV
ncbi:DUF4148 domain-containing protein [Trinickia sp.]|uniref:DUF4148 domain-containing protein n=1 Tax=Trinickia sp. TaxID=2571163 RepID=UPI003F814F8E